jgi:uncharacterized membrane protein YkoI
MKKLFALLTVFALFLPVLAGCQSTPMNVIPGNASGTPQPLQTTPVSPAPDPVPQTTVSATPETQLTREEARSIALKHAGLTADEVRDLDVELDRDDGTLHYDVDFEADGYDYEYEIHATSGKILRSEKDRD